MYGLRLVEQADTEAVWEVDVGEVAWYATAQHAVVRRVRARFFQAELPPISLEAEYGHVAQASGNMSVSGHVRLQHPAGYTVTTDSLHWRVTDRVLYTDAPVQIVSPTMRIRGVGFRSEIAQRQFELQQNVRASLRLD
jgi:LPS export ABC transporter protein LptC